MAASALRTLSVAIRTSRMHSFVKLPIHTKRLLLRPLAATDTVGLFAIFSDVEVMRYWSTPPWTSLEQARFFLERNQEGLAAGQHLRLGIVTVDDGALIGQCTFFGIIPSCRRAELGYSLARDSWGKGYANEALQALVSYGFDTLNLNRIEADIDPRNVGSEKVLDRLGFVQEGYMKERWIVGDEVSDSKVYGLLRRDWRASNASDA